MRVLVCSSVKKIEEEAKERFRSKRLPTLGAILSVLYDAARSNNY